MSFKKFAKSLIKTLALVALVITVSLETPHLYKGYMRNIAEENVVRIVGINGMGTGFHVQIEGKTYLLTNKHVCNMAGPLKVEKYGAKEGIVRKVIKRSNKHDLCIMEALPGVEGIRIGSDAENGDTVYTLGHPRGDALNVASGEKFDDKDIHIGEEVSEDGTCAEGVLTEYPTFFGVLSICDVTRNTIQISSPTYPGNSGSPLVNKWGNLVGVIFAGSREVENMGFAVPLSFVKEFLSSVK